MNNAIDIDLGGSQVSEAVISSPQGEIIRQQLQTTINSGGEDLLQQLTEMAEHLQDGMETAALGIGIFAVAVNWLSATLSGAAGLTGAGRLALEMTEKQDV